MRKLIDFGAGFTVAWLILGIIISTISLVGVVVGSASNGGIGVGVIITGIVVTVGLIVGYFFLMKKLGVWNESAWYTMSGGRKTALFLLVLPGLLVSIIFIIILAIFGVFSETAGEALKRAKFRSDVESAVHQELERHGF